MGGHDVEADGRAPAAGRSVADGLFAVLDCFDVTTTALTLTDIADASGLPLSTARRMIVALVRWGGLEHQSDGRYRVGIRLWQIGSLATRQRDLREAAVPVMKDLCDATRENVQLAVLHEHEALCIEKISSASAVPTATHVGGRLPLHATGVGKIILAHSPPELLRTLVDGGLRRVTANTVVEPGRLAAQLRDVRDGGLAFCYEEMTVGAVSVAAPILHDDGALRAAVGIVTRAHTRLDRLAPAVRTAALGIARACR